MIDAAVQLFEDCAEKNGGLLDRALAETMQYIALLGLSRSDFFHRSAFYGGTALRMLYGLDRFSEDLDFTLLEPDDEFLLADYLTFIQNELLAYGFHTEVEIKQKSIQTPIESAFIKAGTRTHILEARIPEPLARRFPANETCKVKCELDIDPPRAIGSDISYISRPIPFAVRACDGPTLFAGKLAAILTRGWRHRIKGRDWFDMIFLINKNISASLLHLENRLRQVGFYTDDEPLHEVKLRYFLEQRIREIDIELAKQDVVRFIRNPHDVDIWSKEYFLYEITKLRTVSG